MRRAQGFRGLGCLFLLFACDGSVGETGGRVTQESTPGEDAALLDSTGTSEGSTGSAGAGQAGDASTVTQGDANTDSAFVLDSGPDSFPLGCSATPPPDSVPCPAQCLGGCATGWCNIQCAVPGQCAGGAQCPAGLNCAVTCSGFQSCSGIVNCPPDHDCNVTCSGANECSQMTVNCGGGACNLLCSGAQTCAGATQVCGTGPCSCSAITTALVGPLTSCGNSCSCAPCL